MEFFERSEKNAPKVIVKAPEVLLEKFEIEKTEAEAKEVTKNQPPSTPKMMKTTQVKTSAVVKKEIPKKVSISKSGLVQTKKLPSDYPEVMSEINKKADLVWKRYKPNHFTNEKIYLDSNQLHSTVVFMSLMIL